MFCALMHTEKTECSYAGYQRMKKSTRMEYPPTNEAFRAIEYYGVSDTLNGPIVRVERLLTPLSYAGNLGALTPVLLIY